MRVSVVIPLYNVGMVIKETVASVLSQTWKDYEIILIDDGSTDGSAQIARELNSSIRYICQKNAGVARARNRGIEEATGEYVALLDHDDLWSATKLEKQVGVLDRRPEVGMVITDVVHIDRDGRPMGIVGLGYNPGEGFARLFVKGYVPTPSAAMIRKSVLASVGGFDESFQSAGLDDQELWTRIAESWEIAHLPEPLTYHRNLGVKPAHVELEHKAIMIPKLLERFGHDPDRRQYLLEAQAGYFADMGKLLVQQGHAEEGRAHFIKGLSMSLGEARSLKTAWRCASRLARSYAGS